MQRLAAPGAPLLPLSWDLTDGCVRAARNIANYTIITYTSIFTNLAVLVFEFGEVLSIMVGNDYICRVETIHLMSQHEGSLRVGIVSYDKARGLIAIWPSLVKRLVGLDELE